MNWQTKKLGDLINEGIVQLTRGKIISKKDISAHPGNYPIYSSAKENDGMFGRYGYFMFDEPLITWSVDGGGRLFYRPEHRFSVTNVGGVLRILKPAILDYQYLFHALSFKHSEIRFDWVKKAHPSVIRELYKGIPIPSLAEQKIIVGKLNEVFEDIVKVKENTEKNLQNSKDLFESYLQTVFINPGKDWEEKRLEELGIITSSKRIYKKEYVKDGIPFYRIKEIKELAHDKNITIELYISQKRYSEIKDVFGVPLIGDVLMTAVGTIGEIYVVKSNKEFYFKDGNILWFKNFESVNPYFLKFILMSFVEQINKLSKGSAYSALTIEKIEKHKIFVPPLSEQKAIVAKLDALAEQTKKLEEIYKKKLEDLEELKKSVLQKAFTGEL